MRAENEGESSWVGTGMDAEVPPLAIGLLGPWDLRLYGAPLPSLLSRKERWLLALLVLRKGRALDREWLAGALWPDSRDAQALYNLRSSLSDLRRALGREARRLLAPTARTVGLDLAGAWVDVIRFDDAIARAGAAGRGEGVEPALEAAVKLYRGPLLAGCDEEWILPERAAREQAYLEALERLAAQASARGDHAATARFLRRSLATDPLRESTHRALMQALASAGSYAAATQVYRDLRLLLHRELNAAPGAETSALFEQIRAEERALRVAGHGSRVTGREMKDVPGAARPVTRDPRPAAQLPRPVSSFVGRVREVREIAASLAEARLVTLTGPGGVGKTRLAIQVAQEVAEEYTDGVCFVDLAALGDATVVPHAVARALGAAEQPGRPLIETLGDLLPHRELLLVLDNCEHLIDACAPLVQALLHACPDLRVLATSRQSLGIAGETTWRVPPLSLPAAGVGGRGSGVGEGQTGKVLGPCCPSDPRPPTPDPLIESEAVRLFVERGRAAARSFTLSEGNARVTVELCRRLDGIPLAIELAAARLKALSVEQISSHLNGYFGLLTGGSRTSPPRQQTLRATMDWSYDLLSEPERALLRRLSVFSGGFTLEAAEAVCGDFGFRISDFGSTDLTAEHAENAENKSTESPGGLGRVIAPSQIRNPKSEIRNEDVLDLLTELVDKSSVQHEVEEGRYRLLETVREYARERMLDREEVEAVCDRHLAFYLRLAEEADTHLRGPERIAWLERLETEHDNLRAALEWNLSVSSRQSAVGSPDPSHAGSGPGAPSRLPTAYCLLPSGPGAALRLAAALVGFWETRGHLAEGRRRLEAVLEWAGPWRRSEAGARALEGAGRLAFLQGDYEAAHACYTDSLEIRCALGDRRGAARSRVLLGLLAYEQGNSPAARPLLEEGLAIQRELGDPAGVSGALGVLAHVAYHQGEIALARSLSEEHLAIERELGDPNGIAFALMGLGRIARRLEDYSLARALQEEGLAIRRTLGDQFRVAESLVMLGATMYAQQEYPTARTYLEEALAIQRALGDRRGGALALDALADMAWRQGDYAAGRRFIEECLALWRAAGSNGGVIHALGLLGHLARAQGEYAEAHAAYAESLLLRQQTQDLYDVINGLEDFAELAASEGDWERVMRLLGAALAQREAAGKPLLPRGRAHYDEMLRRAREALSEQVTAAAWAEGQAMTLEQSVRAALA